eukprot:9234452-Pyramimonas_sp.AAC.1
MVRRASCRLSSTCFLAGRRCSPVGLSRGVQAHQGVRARRMLIEWWVVSVADDIGQRTQGRAQRELRMGVKRQRRDFFPASKYVVVHSRT